MAVILGLFFMLALFIAATPRVLEGLVSPSPSTTESDAATQDEQPPTTEATSQQQQQQQSVGATSQQPAATSQQQQQQSVGATSQQQQQQQPVSQQPVLQQPVSQQPVSQQPVSQHPVSQQPVAQQLQCINDSNSLNNPTTQSDVMNLLCGSYKLNDCEVSNNIHCQYANDAWSKLTPTPTTTLSAYCTAPNYNYNMPNSCNGQYIASANYAKSMIGSVIPPAPSPPA